MLIQDVAKKICWEQWTIETDGETGAGKSVLAARHDDDFTHRWDSNGYYQSGSVDLGEMAMKG